MAVDTNHEVFSSDWTYGGITIRDRPTATSRCRCSSPWTRPSTTPSARWSARSSRPTTWRAWSDLIRERAAKILDDLPVGETFDWVDQVSIELTTQMLATLFDFPFEDRRKLTYWSDVATACPGAGGIVETEDERPPMLMRVPRLFHAAVERAGQRRQPAAT